VKLLEEMKSLKKLSLSMNEVSRYEERAEEWKKFKEDVRKICVKRNIEIVRYDDFFLDFERDDLAWID
jgi:Ran GTPase-activating protein (RanGAP) involved in mRNA processing and transport